MKRNGPTKRLRSFREGWNHERFARYVVGKVAFIATPDSIGDDIGVDLSCFFIKESKSIPRHLLPGSAFVVQVKPPSFRTKGGDVSARYRHFLAERIREYVALRLPIYIGIVHSNQRQIDIYSCQGIWALIATHGTEELVELMESRIIDVEIRLAEETRSFPVSVPRAGVYELLLHKVTSISDATGIDSVEVTKWADDCDLYVRTIDSFIAGEFVFDGPGMQLAQFMGLGTFSNAMKRMMHAGAMLAEEIHLGNRFARQRDVSDEKFVKALGEIAQYLDLLRGRLADSSVFDDIVDARRWEAWSGNISKIAERLLVRSDTSN